MESVSVVLGSSLGFLMTFSGVGGVNVPFFICFRALSSFSVQGSITWEGSINSQRLSIRYGMKVSVTAQTGFESFPGSNPLDIKDV
ncbi:hypothetical protein SARC_18259 [Sphaeroforma arctica JP610]|uniref:Uncharacterized protein n=1 Tax=Sphaeroforma arctica JP610 TaxID=667725 RepID=A0A0L0ENQ0_9EUKA|nr:hypothetical protein SARC_18259 [Sphaeroforma arctica JP610]KNC66026.1 hypothetical protein SARC_18259 [Sphaeroforma arctica JP610]|eukprot:XP_014143135.1 hypothetical protein SARC_18259 [Sphaeroforma arctica JP610]